jgi:PAS domain-containing protein
MATGKRLLPGAGPKVNTDRRFEALLLASASIVWWTDAAGNFVEEQPYWEAYTGQPWEEHRGSGWIACVHADDRESIVAD